MTFIQIPYDDFVKIKWQIYHTYELRGQTFSKYLGKSNIVCFSHHPPHSVSVSIDSQSL